MKKFIHLILSLLLCAASLVVASACAISDFQKVEQAFEKTENVVKAVKEVRVSREQDLLRSVTEEYTLEEETYTVVTSTRVRNPIGAGEEFTDEVTTQTVKAEDIRFGSLPAEEALGSIVYSGDLVLEAKITDPDAIGLTAEDVGGDIFFRAELKDDLLEEAEIQYTAPSGNDVVISLRFTY